MASIKDLFKHREKNGVYITASEDHTWSAFAKPQKQGDPLFKLTDEKDYPVKLYYRRTDLNGSSVYEMDICMNREELLSSLNWIGQCRNVILSLWDYDEREPVSQELADIFSAAAERKYELDKELAAEFAAEFANLFANEEIPPDTHVWITVYKDTLGFQDDYDNLTEICVPTAWLCKQLAAEGEEPEKWFQEYTADHTIGIAEKALREGVISGCSDPGINLPVPHQAAPEVRKEPLSSQISHSNVKSSAGISKSGPVTEPER